MLVAGANHGCDVRFMEKFAVIHSAAPSQPGASGRDEHVTGRHIFSGHDVTGRYMPPSAM